jgi:hypothetical protein
MIERDLLYTVEWNLVIECFNSGLTAEKVQLQHYSTPYNLKQRQKLHKINTWYLSQLISKLYIQINIPLHTRLQRKRPQHDSGGLLA